MKTLSSTPRNGDDFVADEFPRGVKLLHDPVRNKGTAFSEAERTALGLNGLLPPRVHTQEEQVQRVVENLARKESDLERYIALVALQDRNETLFYRVVTDHLRELMPVIYTPTVGEACEKFGHIFRRPRGLYVSSRDRGHVDRVLANWPHEDVRVVVVTDGERILGLGDLGAAGMGIPIGKLVLYSACAGIHPTQCLPVTVDVGTNNTELLRDPLYIGLSQQRLTGADYDSLIDEFLEAVHRRFPHAVIQLEDFANHNAFRLLHQYRDRYCIFDDDIQGTGAVALAGLLATERITGKELIEQRFLFLGAGEAGIGIADIIVEALVEAGISREDARERCWFYDSKGLVVRSRQNLAPHKIAYAHDFESADSFVDAIRVLEPTAIIGVSGTPGSFDRRAVEAMSEVNDRPVIFALSNPTSRSECTARQAYMWSGGRAVFASGSPFDAVELDGKTFTPGQANNAYIFPGVGLGAVAAESRLITDEMFLTAAKVLANEVSEGELSLGHVFPSLSRVRQVAARIGTAVSDLAYERGLSDRERPEDIFADVKSRMFEPDYPEYVS